MWVGIWSDRGGCCVPDVMCVFIVVRTGSIKVEVWRVVSIRVGWVIVVDRSFSSINLKNLCW